MDKADIVREAFLHQAKACDELGSPFTARLCRLAAGRLDETTAIGRHVLGWQGDPATAADSVPLRLAGALHALVRSGSDPVLAKTYPPHEVGDEDLWRAVESALERDEPFLRDRLRSAPQTNEVRRSAALLPGFLTIGEKFARPLILSEVGASAGLNLQWDRYAYRLGEFGWGMGAPVTLAPDWSGPPPPSVALTVAERAGCDLNPLDPRSVEDQERLLSYIWADQPDRLERTRLALGLAAAHDMRVEKADAIDWLADRLARPYPGNVHVIYHSIAWQYFPETLKARGEALIGKAGARATIDAPLARLQMEADGKPDGASVTLQLWPTGERYEIGRADFHGRWVQWKGWPAA